MGAARNRMTETLRVKRLGRDGLALALLVAGVAIAIMVPSTTVNPCNTDGATIPGCTQPVHVDAHVAPGRARSCGAGSWTRGTVRRAAVSPPRVARRLYFAGVVVTTQCL